MEWNAVLSREEVKILIDDIALKFLFCFHHKSEGEAIQGRQKLAPQISQARRQNASLNRVDAGVRACRRLPARRAARAVMVRGLVVNVWSDFPILQLAVPASRLVRKRSSTSRKFPAAKLQAEAILGCTLCAVMTPPAKWQPRKTEESEWKTFFKIFQSTMLPT